MIRTRAAKHLKVQVSRAHRLDCKQGWMVVFELLEAVRERSVDGSAVLRVIGEVRLVQRAEADVIALKEDKK